MKKNDNTGMLSTFVGGTLWGINGVMGNYLFLNKNVTTPWLIPYRLILAGFLLLGYLYYKKGTKIFDVLKNPKDLFQIVLFGFIGMLGTQYTYFSAIQFSNAAIATVLTYFGPTLVLIYMCLREKRKPLKYEIVSICLSSFGVFLLATHGDFTSLQISFKALVWGILSALSVVFYTVQPESLLKKYGASIVVAWGMMIGGIFITFVTKPWNISVTFDFVTFLVLMLIIVFGTIIAFILYLTGVNIIGPTKASIIACIEPVAATICAILFLGVTFDFLDVIGFICIISTIFIVAYFDKKTKVKKK
ncbi:MAG: EamA family transporter [Fusobacterium periodonticum]|nr:EamA family transporter [Fusobacterium periodonticum]